MPKKKSLKTIKQLADELNLEKKRVEYQVSKLGDDLVPKIDGVRYITTESESIIREGLGAEPLPKLDTESGIDSVLVSQLELLEKELQHKNNQIEQLHKLLDQQQQLQLTTNRQNEQLQQQNQLLLNGNHPNLNQIDDTDADKQHSDINDLYNLNDYRSSIERRKRRLESGKQRIQEESNRNKEIMPKKWWQIW